MFAPPPTATLSRAEIEARRAQLRAKRASSTGGNSNSSATELQRAESNPEIAKHEKKKSGRFSANKKDVEEIREEDKEVWKFKKKPNKKEKSASVGKGGSGSSLPTTLLSPPPVPTGSSSLRTVGSDTGSFVESVPEDDSAAQPWVPSPTERKGTWKGGPPKRPARPSGEIFLSPPQSSKSDSFPRALTPESFGGSSFRSANASPATPPPFHAPPPVPGAFPIAPTSNSKASSPKPPPLPSPPLLRSPTSLPGPVSPPPSTPPPPVPEKSPLRQQRATRPNSNPVRSTGTGPTAAKKQHSMSTDAALSTAMAELRMAMKDPISIGQTAGEQQQRPPHPLRAATAPAAEISVLTGIKPLQVRKSVKSPVKSSSRSGTGSNVKTIAGSHNATVTSPTKSTVPASRAQRIARQGIKRQVVTHHRGGSSGNSARLGAHKQARSPTKIMAPRPRRAKGETMAMLETSGFFSDTTRAALQSKDSNVRIQIPSATRFIDKDLPDTPNSIAPTPTELYQPSRNSLILARKSKSNIAGAKRSPLSVITDTDAKSNSSSEPAPADASDEISPHRLTTIMEYKSLSENSPPASGTATPIATQIHLRGGSLVTVTPPEMTAWQRSIYIQGPIRLPKPVILPRKDSVASMEPFQEAIDRVYQNALFVPRRRSDDAIVDDVCEFFDDFGFADLGFGGGLLSIDQAKDATEEDAMDVDELEDGIERFATPPGFPPAGEISPIEKSVAKDVVEASMAKAAPVVIPEPAVSLPPVDNEATLRARGIARLSQQSAGRSSQGSRSSSYKKEVPSLSRPTSETLTASITGDNQEGMLPLLPPPEASMLDAVMEASQTEEAEWVEEMTPDGDAGGMDWSDEDVEETDAGASWTAPAFRRKKQHGLDRALVGREKRNPVAKMRRFVATATTIL